MFGGAGAIVGGMSGKHTETTLSFTFKDGWKALGKVNSGMYDRISAHLFQLNNEEAAAEPAKKSITESLEAWTKQLEQQPRKPWTKLQKILVIVPLSLVALIILIVLFAPDPQLAEEGQPNQTQQVQ